MLKDKVRILIVDDSAFMRKSIEIMLTKEPSFVIAGKARDGLEAVEMAKKLRPDMITMDIEMPRMDGLTALRKIMREIPIPTLMISSLTTEGAENTLKALEIGALDFIPKEKSFISVDIASIENELIKKIKYIVSKSRLKRISGKSIINHTKEIKPVINSVKAVAIGISTGGPSSLQKVLPQLSGKIDVPIFLVQHMPPKFTKSLAQRLNGSSELSVKEAEDGEDVKRGVVYIAPGGRHMAIRKNKHEIFISISDEPYKLINKPSVDVMISSAADCYGKNLMTIIMTGMGHDGLEGVRKAKYFGAYSIAQDESTSIIYGMPKAIADNNLADRILPLESIPKFINNEVNCHEKCFQ